MGVGSRVDQVTADARRRAEADPALVVSKQAASERFGRRRFEKM